jgi:hypothetical protein
MSKRPVIQLGSGREIHLSSLNQSWTYEGLLEGLPTREMNRRRIEGVVAEERAKSHGVWVVPPYETPIPYDGRYPFGEPARLPYVQCIAEFRSPGGDLVTDSRLTIVWFQEEFALPIDATILEQIRRIDWSELAEFYEI